MKHKSLLFLSVLVLGLLTLFSAVNKLSADEKLGPYKLLTTISVPGNLSGGFDISWVDSAAGRYFLADRGNAGIDVIDAENNSFLFTITGFAGVVGPDLSGPNGVVAIHARGQLGAGDGHDRLELWVGDGVPPGQKSTVKVVDLETCNAQGVCKVDSISTGGNHRADELAYDPVDKIILVANDADVPAPFVTFISAESRSVLGKIVYDGSHGNPNSTGGIEQPVWDQQRHLFYLAIPSTVANPNGEVDEIDPRTQMVTRVFSTSCGPAGLALLPGQHLITSCGDVLDIESGKVETTVAGGGGDEIWFNPGDERVYFGGGLDRLSVPVVDIELGECFSPHLITTLTVGTPGNTTHSVAADSENNRIFVPVRNVGVKVYTDDVF